MTAKCKHATTFFKVIATIVIVLQAAINISCNNQTKEKKANDPLANKIIGMDTAKNRWGSWNVLLKDGTGGAEGSAAILTFENALVEQIRSNPLYRDYSIRFQVFYCPCDSLLYNIGGTLINGAGYSVTSPAPPPPPGGSGDILFVSNNNYLPDIDDSLEVSTRPPDKSKKLLLVNAAGIINYASQSLAVIDTGIDTSYFSAEIRRLMTRQSVYNVVGGNVHSFRDDHPGRHGTIVTGLALQAIKDENEKLPQANGKNPLPTLMILKALDSNKRGSTFTVSCALSYAIQHKAAMINASLGYYDYRHTIDSVFSHYVELAKTKAIPIFAAAGNLFTTKDPALICHDAAGSNLLEYRRRFYPACFSTDFDNVLTVTSVTKFRGSCFYQNYSSTYVTLGVRQIKEGLCCHFSLPFAVGEGTSFATPVACGTALSYILNGQSMNEFIASLNREASFSGVTKLGQCMNYSSR